MMERMAAISPLLKARIAGVSYLLTFLAGIPLIVVGSRLIVLDDAAATGANILANELLFCLGFASQLIVAVCYIAVTAFLYDLFRPVSSTVSLLAAFFSLVGLAIQAASSAFYLAPWVILRDAPYLSVFKVEQLQALALMFLKLHTHAYQIGFVFFGFYCLLLGYLIFRSTFLPRVLGALMVFAGLGWLTFLSPPLAESLSPFILVPGLVGEGLLTLWLLVKGVNVQRWEEQAGRGAA